MGATAEFTKKDVAAHTTHNDCWMTIHGEGKKRHADFFFSSSSFFFPRKPVS